MAISIPTAGELRAIVEIIKRVDNPSQELGAVQTDTLLFTAHAKIEAVGGAYYFGAQVNQQTSHRFWFRAIKGKTDVYSFEHGVLLRVKERIYRPVRVTELNNGVYTLIEAIELGVDRPEQGTLLDISEMIDE